MSADNMIYLQQIGDKWYVWMGFASNEDESVPSSRDPKFSTYNEAKAYANGWLRGEYVVEYGIVELQSKAIEHCETCGQPILKSDKELALEHGVFQ